ncbi:putative restin -like [Scophthalmus maximus]|uniref:Putative restin-like n=2 Tax=Scophthalmus maximus TaxID=52904 RepID=A0A2U9AZF9_SCOMX|nr:putative restin -like [Scophthalmus maximus]
MAAAADTVDPQSKSLRSVHKREGCGCSTCHELLQKLAESEHLTQLLQTEIQSLLATVQDLRRRENCLRHHNTHTEFLLLDSEAEIKNVHAVIHVLRENEKGINSTVTQLAAEVELLENQDKRNQGEIRTLRANCDEVTEKLTRMESLMEKKEAQLKKLTRARHDRQEHVDFLSEHNHKVVAELVRLESLREKQKNDHQDLRTSAENCQHQLENAESLILIREELITKLRREIAYNRQTIEEYAIITGDLKKSVRELKAQLERREEEHTLAGIGRLGETSWNAECRAARVPLQEPPAPQKPPAAEARWRHCRKWSLKVALCTTGIAVCILAPAILASGLSCNCDIVYELTHAVCRSL